MKDAVCRLPQKVPHREEDQLYPLVARILVLIAGEFIPDIILSDHGLPGFDSMTALAVAREHLPQVPFIFVTGSRFVPPASNSLVADDYILKTELNALAPAIHRALQSRRLLALEDISAPEKNPLEQRVEELEAASRKAKEELFARNIRVLRLELNAWLAHKAGNKEPSIALMKEAADLEGGIDIPGADLDQVGTEGQRQHSFDDRGAVPHDLFGHREVPGQLRR